MGGLEAFEPGRLGACAALLFARGRGGGGGAPLPAFTSIQNLACLRVMKRNRRKQLSPKHTHTHTHTHIYIEKIVGEARSLVNSISPASYTIHPLYIPESGTLSRTSKSYLVREEGEVEEGLGLPFLGAVEAEVVEGHDP